VSAGRRNSNTDVSIISWDIYLMPLLPLLGPQTVAEALHQLHR
jgi:hypothetical protein